MESIHRGREKKTRISFNSPYTLHRTGCVYGSESAVGGFFFFLLRFVLPPATSSKTGIDDTTSSGEGEQREFEGQPSRTLDAAT